MGRKQLKYIELDDEEGRLYAAGEQHLLFPISIVELLRGILRKIAGDAAAEALMYRIGEGIGREYAKRVKGILEESKVELDKDALLAQVYCTAMQSGWGEIKKIKWTNPEKNKIEIQGRNFPCQGLEGCGCALERGILAGSYHEIIGVRIYFALTNKTEDAVVFKSLEEAPPEVLKAEELALLSKTELEEVIRKKTFALEQSRVATLNIAQDLDKARRETEKAKMELEELTGKLERSNRELQDFVYIVSHDLKAPMRKVSMFGELLKEPLAGRLNEDEKENFDFMIEGATRMQELIDDLLIYSRVTTKAKPPERVDLNEVIEDLKNVELAIQLEETGGVIEVQEPLSTVYADPSQMHQLMQNLIGNGLKYHREGVPPVVTIRNKQDGNVVRIEVQDNGIGISEGYHDKIFKMFQRLHSDEEYEGTGVGLAVCKKIVERHGGEIGVGSTADGGSRFWFTIPIANDKLITRRIEESKK